MKRIIVFAIACFWCATAFAQLKITQAGTDCRMKPEEIQPMIDSQNPFFCNHFWNDKEKTEIAQIDPDRFLAIAQEACVRHHAKVKLTVTPEATGLLYDDFKFYIDEMVNVLNKLYYNDIDFYLYRFEFEKLLTQNLIEKGFNRKFDFHIADRTFVCQFEGGKWGAALNIEIAKIIHPEIIQLPGIKEYLDDGRYKNQE